MLTVQYLQGFRQSRLSTADYALLLLISTLSKPILELIHSPIQWVPGTLSPGVKRQRRKDEYSSPTTDEVKNTCIYTFTPFRKSSWRSA
jgi:hypothetical protein